MMRLPILLCFLAVAGLVPARTDASESLPFEVGEKLVFSVRYGFIKAGEAVMEVRGLTSCPGGECFHLVSEARSTGAFSLFFEVRDRVESHMDAEGLYTWRYEKNLHEGNHRAHEVVLFDHARRTATYPDGKVVEIPAGVQDVLSSLYYVRTLDLEVGSSVFIDNHADGKNYPLEVRVLKREMVEVPAGEFDCLVLEPILKASGVFQHKGRLTVWVTADDGHVPVMMKSKIVIGSISAELIAIENH
jgi:hypothetical protein